MAINFEQIPNPIEAGQIIRAGHVSQSLVAFSGLDAYDINLSGSFAMTGSIYHIEIDDAAGVASSVLVRDNTTGEYYTTGSYGGSSGGGSGSSGSSGTSGSSGSSGTSGIGTDGSSGSSGTSGVGTDGSSGSSGTSGTGTDGSSGSSGTSGIAGSSGSSGTSGDSGSSGSSGTSGVGTDGSSGSSGTSGVGTDGSSGSSGTSGTDGSSGSSGTSGAAGSSGSSGTSGLLSDQPMYDVSTRSTSGTGFSVNYQFISGTTYIPTGVQKIIVSINEIADLYLGDEVHITATAYGDETTSYPNIIIYAGNATLPLQINNSGQITFLSSITVPATGLFIMYHIMYTTDDIPG